jgi:hypothetical protein
LGTYSAHGLKVGRGLVLKILRVGDLAWCPDTLVGWVVDVRCSPLALVVWVALHWELPFAAAGGFVTLGVGNLRCDPVAILLVIPILGFLGFWIGNHCWLVLQPISRLGSLVIWNLIWRILIPVLRLLSFRVRDTSVINPIGRLLVLWIINLLLRVDRRGEVFKDAAVTHLLSVNANSIRVVRVDGELVEGSGLVGASHWGVVEMLLLILASLWVLVSEDKVDLIGGTTLIGPKHDDIWRSIGEFITVKLFVLLEKL